MNIEEAKCTKNVNIVVFLMISLSFFEYMLRFTVLGSLKLYFGIVVIVFLYAILEAITNLKKVWVIWIPFYIVVVGQWVIYSYSAYYLLIYITAIGIPMMFMKCSEKLIERSIKMISWISLFFAIGCIFQKVFESAYLSIVSNLFISEIRSGILKWNAWGMMSGVSYQPTAAGATICIGIVVSWINTNKKNIIVQVILYFALLLTAKRMFLIISIVVPIIVYYVSGSKQSKFSKTLFIIGIAGTILYIFNSLSNQESELIIVDRLINAIESNDLEEVTSGRNTLMRNALDLYKSDIFFGIGWGNFSKIYGTSVHNVYVQLLAETGTLGFISFIFPAVITLIGTILKARELEGESQMVIYTVKFSLGIQLLFLFYSFTGNPLYNTQWIYLYFIACSLYYVIKICKKGSIANKNFEPQR